MKTIINRLFATLFVLAIFSCQVPLEEDEVYASDEEMSSTALSYSSTIFNPYHYKHKKYGSRRDNDFLLNDIKGDNRVDLVKIGNDGAVSIALGNSSGRFNGYHYEHRNYGSRRSNDFLLGDINGDNRADLVKIGDDNVISIALGYSSGRFGSYIHRLTRHGGRGNDWRLNDVNGDGRADLVKINNLGEVSVGLGQTSGSFGPNTFYQPWYGSARDNDFLLNDINRDGKADLVKIGNDGTVSIAYGNSSGRFGSYVHRLQNYGDRRDNDFLLDDINRDSRADLVKIGNDGIVSVALADYSTGKFDIYRYRHTNYGSRRDNDFLLGDINGDNKADLVKIGNDGAVSIALAK